MDQPQYSSLMGLLAAVPDPRQARGKQLEWSFIVPARSCETMHFSARL